MNEILNTTEIIARMLEGTQMEENVTEFLKYVHIPNLSLQTYVYL